MFFDGGGGELGLETGEDDGLFEPVVVVDELCAEESKVSKVCFVLRFDCGRFVVNVR